MPSLEQILCRGRFRHPGSYRTIPSLSTVCTRTLADSTPDFIALRIWSRKPVKEAQQFPLRKLFYKPRSSFGLHLGHRAYETAALSMGIRKEVFISATSADLCSYLFCAKALDIRDTPGNRHVSRKQVREPQNCLTNSTIGCCKKSCESLRTFVGI
jgi:hypothetical protein